MAALLQEKLRRKAQRNLLAFTKYTMPTFEESWHHAEIAKYLELLDRRAPFPGFKKGLDGLIICAPPRHTKSEEATVRRPAWSIGRDPSRQFMIAAYAGPLATSFSRACRDVMRDAPYQDLWPTKFVTFADSHWQVKRPGGFDNKKESMIAAGITQGGFTGEGATDFIIDDPFKNQSEAYSAGIRDKVWDQYRTVARTRLQPGGTICVQQTRWHHDDLVGRLLKMATSNPKARQFVVLVLSATNDDGQQSYVWNTATGEKTYYPKYDALWPAWWPRDVLDGLEVELGPAFWQAMYKQAPTEAQGTILKRDCWQYFTEPGRPLIQRLIHVYDTALEEKKDNDYSAMLEMATVQAGFAVMDGWRDKVPFPKLVEQVYDRWARAGRIHGRYPEWLVIEWKGSGISLGQQIEANNIVGEWIGPDGKTRRVPYIPIVKMPATTSKEVRAHGISGYQNARQCWLPQYGFSDPECRLEDFVDETAVFPKGANDDWTDCFVHGMTMFTRPMDETEESTIVHAGQDISISDALDDIDLDFERLL
jgi:hypothetical protein